MPTVTTAPMIRPNHTTPGIVSPVESARLPRAASAVATWSSRGW